MNNNHALYNLIKKSWKGSSSKAFLAHVAAAINEEVRVNPGKEGMIQDEIMKNNQRKLGLNT